MVLQVNSTTFSASASNMLVVVAIAVLKKVVSGILACVYITENHGVLAKTQVFSSTFSAISWY